MYSQCQLNTILTTNTATWNNDIGLNATIANPSFTGTVTGITQSMVGLSIVNNTSDIAKPISTSAQSAINF